LEKSEILNLENRRLIYNFILNNPGLHLREISRRLNMKYFNINYHINYLKKLGLLVTKSENRYLRIYIKDKIGNDEKIILNIIRKKTPRHILIFMSTFAITSQKELSKLLEKHPSTIKEHLDKLIELNIIEPAEIKDGMALTNHRSGRNVLRKPKNHETLFRCKDYDMIKKTFYKYKKSLFEDKIFKEALEYLTYAHNESKKYRKNCKKTKHIRPFEYYLDKMIEIYNEMAPFPFLS